MEKAGRWTADFASGEGKKRLAEFEEKRRISGIPQRERKCSYREEIQGGFREGFDFQAVVPRSPSLGETGTGINKGMQQRRKRNMFAGGAGVSKCMI
jgi:hypothetical protein